MNIFSIEKYVIVSLQKLFDVSLKILAREP